MSNFLDDNLNQSVFFDINYLEVLGSNTFEYCLYHLLENDDVPKQDRHCKETQKVRTEGWQKGTKIDQCILLEE